MLFLSPLYLRIIDAPLAVLASADRIRDYRFEVEKK
jgi:hypothetical protein